MVVCPMPVNFLSEPERTRLSQFPPDIPEAELIQYFTLTADDLEHIQRQRQSHNRLGFALQLCALRYMGFCPDDLQQAPLAVVAFLSKQIEGAVVDISAYAQRSQTRTDHFQQAQSYLGFRSPTAKDLRGLEKWLIERALEHDQPSLLFQLAAERLYKAKLTRPGVTILERRVAAARHKAMKVTYQQLKPVLKSSGRKFCNQLFAYDADIGDIRLTWLRRSAARNSPTEILSAIKKIRFLQSQQVQQWDLSALNPNRLKFLARLAKKTSVKSLQRSPAERRYPLLIAFAHQRLMELTDEAADLFIRCLADTHARARRDLKEFRQREAVAINEKVRLFQHMGEVVLDPNVDDAQVRPAIFERIPREDLETAVTDCERLIRPAQDESHDFFAARYSYIRQFAPAFIQTFTFRSHQAKASLLEAVQLLRQLNESGKRRVPKAAPTDFVKAAWKSLVLNDEGQIQRRHYELCVLWELRLALRSGAVWIEGGRRYANPESYLIPREKWPDLRREFCQMASIPQAGQQRLQALSDLLDEELRQLSETLKQKAHIRLEDDEIVISPLEAEAQPERLKTLKALVAQCLPQVELAELITEVDQLTRFSESLVHTDGKPSRIENTEVYLYASILAQACNLGPASMARVANLSYESLLWHTNWFLDETTLPKAITTLVNYHHQLPLTQAWGGGTLSSSDGQRFPVAVKNTQAASLPRYFGYGKGVTFYTWLSDQFSQYGSKVIPSTNRDATYLLDGIQDNETELKILEHTTDTAGYTEVVFAFFDLCGFRFSPRIRDLADQQLYSLQRHFADPSLKPLFKGRIQQHLIVECWDDMLRISASQKFGWVTASLFMNKLRSLPEPNRIWQAFQEYGRLVKTIFILQYLNRKDYRRRINRQLNKGESVHSLRRYLLFARQGELRQRHAEGLENQANCLTLLTNAVVVWNTVYMSAALDYIQQQGFAIEEADKAHLSPARFEHINPYGKIDFDIPKTKAMKGLRQLRPIKIPEN